MPHFGLIDEDKLGPVQSLLMRARLHIRGGRLRLQQGHISLGIITLYDALCIALQWYISVPENIHNLGIITDEIIKDEKAIISALVAAGVLDGKFSYDEFNDLVGTALNEELSGFNNSEMLHGIEHMMGMLGVMPFDENQLPADKGELDNY